MSILETGQTNDGRRIELRLAVPEDAEIFIQVVDTVAREGRFFLRSRFSKDLDEEQAFLAGAPQHGNLILLALVEGLLVGWVTMIRGRPEFLRHTAELGMGVLRAYRGLGIGTALMDYALRWAAEQGYEKVNLGVRASNEPAIALYRKFGFVREGYKVREVKDLEGRYDDDLEMAFFVPARESGVD